MKLSDRVLSETIMRVTHAGPREFDRPMFLAEFDIEAQPEISASVLMADGALVNGAFGGRIWLTTNRAEAHKFADAADALETWNTVSKTRPWRPDGEPNKPLTALSIQLEPVRLS